ncbi:hypothetical protein BURKHO8Y_120233 [Burkholderia sp. 8Y]|uniref:hypothetical protein n=1 Tax=Burkholderia sp. 8Y TaxID=2653133 RepID=UPI0012EF165F|nr:hypothetical protein [Burkholderia sp. 8Y]VXB42261.1 hypothetical protein BURKHO8Y_120233 [Burkholderia sp. 8Y]
MPDKPSRKQWLLVRSAGVCAKLSIVPAAFATALHAINGFALLELGRLTTQRRRLEFIAEFQRIARCEMTALAH